MDKKTIGLIRNSRFDVFEKKKDSPTYGCSFYVALKVSRTTHSLEPPENVYIALSEARVIILEADDSTDRDVIHRVIKKTKKNKTACTLQNGTDRFDF